MLSYFYFLSLTTRKGTQAFPAGRLGDKESPVSGLSSTLDRIGFKLGRLKTGTPARLDKKTINFDGMEKQEGEANPWPFSFLTKNVTNKVSAYSAHCCGMPIVTTLGQSNSLLQDFYHSSHPSSGP
jgi:tRNA uridine 5-carboxymethylaminomethyl modification enzyme